MTEEGWGNTYDESFWPKWPKWIWLVGQVCVFQHQAIFQLSVDTDWVSCNLIQVWPYVPGVSDATG